MPNFGLSYSSPKGEEKMFFISHILFTSSWFNLTSKLHCVKFHLIIVDKLLKKEFFSPYSLSVNDALRYSVVSQYYYSITFDKIHTFLFLISFVAVFKAEGSIIQVLLRGLFSVIFMHRNHTATYWTKDSNHVIIVYYCRCAFCVYSSIWLTRTSTGKLTTLGLFTWCSHGVHVIPMWCTCDTHMYAICVYSSVWLTRTSTGKLHHMHSTRVSHVQHLGYMYLLAYLNFEFWYGWS